ncbi:MAG: LVIVD repeat-containing protein [Acidimicrobiales bacterium]
MAHGEDIDGFISVGHSDLGGYGDGMQIARNGDALYVGHSGTTGMGTTILDVADPSNPVVVRQIASPAGGHSHKAVWADGILLTNMEGFHGGTVDRPGMAIYDTTDPLDPEEIGFWNSTGKGVHRIYYPGGQYVYLSSTPDGFSDRIWNIVDVSDPTNPVEAGRWWYPGMANDEVADWPADEGRSVHHALINVARDRAYVGMWGSGMAILDITDFASPSLISHLTWEVGGHTHTCLPLVGRDLLVVTDEAVKDGCEDHPHMVRVIDIRDDTNPEVLAICPVPEGDFCERGHRFGAHNLHENLPGSYQSQHLVFVSYFNAGLRAYDVTEPSAPSEVAHWIPSSPPDQSATQINDLYVSADHTIFTSDRLTGGLYVVRPDDALSARMTAASSAA